MNTEVAHPPDPTDVHAVIEHNMSLHSPAAPEIGDAMQAIRSRFKELAHGVADVVPPGRERSMALTALEDGLMYSIAGIARNQPKARELWKDAQ